MPTVVFGYFALTFVTPTILQDLLNLNVSIFNALAAGARDGVHDRADDRLDLRGLDARRSRAACARAPTGSAATKRQVATRVVFPAAISGVVASIVLGISRGVGETMIVLVAAGLQPNYGINPTEGYATVTTFMGATAQGRQPGRHDRLRVDLRLRADSLRAHPGDEHGRDPVRAQVPRGLRVSASATRRRRSSRRDRSSPPVATRAGSSSASRLSLLACLAIAIDGPRGAPRRRLRRRLRLAQPQLPHRRPVADHPRELGDRPGARRDAVADGRLRGCS